MRPAVASRQPTAQAAITNVIAAAIAIAGACVRHVVSLLRDSRATIVVCPDVQDPTNLGSIIRTSAAFGCAAVVLGRSCADPFSRRVLRVSMGAALAVPVVEARDLAADVQALQGAEFEIVASVIDRHAQPLASEPRAARLALLLGGEGHGLTDDWLAVADRRVTIPMQLGIDSLNVAVAAAVLLYEFCSEPTHRSP